MIGLDTNVLLRLFVESDDPNQSQRARRFVQEQSQFAPLAVNVVVLAEFAWALAKSLKLPKSEIVKYLDGVLKSDDIQIQSRAQATAALAAYRRGRADFADYLLAEINLSLGCASTASFDGAALKSPLFSSVP
jgi:predicted nucleic-acid-binding protein